MTFVSSLRNGKILVGVRGKKADALVDEYKKNHNLEYNYQIDLLHFTNWAGRKGYKVIWWGEL